MTYSDSTRDAGRVGRLVFLLALFCIGFGFMSMGDDAPNLLRNPGFEEKGGGKAPAGWVASDWSPKDQRAPIAGKSETDDPAEGNAFVTIDYQGKGTNLVLYQDIPNPSPGQYQLTIKCRPTGTAHAWASAITLTGGKTDLYKNSPKLAPNGQWQQLVVPFTVENPADTLRIALRGTATGAQFDDVILTGPAPGAEPSTGAQLKAARAPSEPFDAQADERRKAAMGPEERAWETVLEQNLGNFYLPLYKKAKLAGRETAWDFVKDDPALPRVLLIGDSISRGYTLVARHALAGRANVHRAPANCGPTAAGLQKLDLWLGRKGWDLIHFNFGIHDRNTDPGTYAKNLRQIVAKLKATGATLVWASSTPLSGKMLGEDGADPMEKMNSIAADIMMENRIRINDLHSEAQPILKTMQGKDGCHFNGEGYQVLGKAVANTIARQLSLPPAP
jgi:lysophospholipase L1-like esterase